jgi:hypothetical protein
MKNLDDNYKLTNSLDEKIDSLKCMDGTNSKTISQMKITFTWMKVTRRMKYLDECGA